MVSRALLLRSLVISLCCTRPGSTFNFHFKDLNGTEIQDIDDYCKTTQCVVKCCPQQQIMVSNGHSKCTSLQELLKRYGVAKSSDFSEVHVYNKHIRQKKSKSASDFKFIHDSKFTENAVNNTGNNLHISFNDRLLFFYLLENGKLALKQGNDSEPAIAQRRQFCIEFEISLVGNDTLASTIPSASVWVMRNPETSNLRNVLGAYGLLVSSAFLVLVLAVYALLPELRNMAGLILMAFMATYFTFGLIRIIHVFGNESNVLSWQACYVMTVIFYYLTLAFYCWMNVMSFDIWWTFRGIRNLSQRHRGMMSAFRKYCAYAWGAPLVPTLFVVIVDQLDLTDLEPRLPTAGSPNCYFEPQVYLRYVSIPIFVLNGVNVLLFLMTAYNIWEVKRRISRYNFKDSRKTKNNEYRFWIYLRLSLVMGVSWVLEAISNFVEPKSPAWLIAELYNALTGLFIFLLFVCKKKIFLRLCTRFSINNRLVRWVSDARAPDAITRTGLHSDTSNFEAHFTSDATVRI